MITEKEKKARRERLFEASRRAGSKMTQQRLVIFDEVAQRRDHPDAETVFRAVRRRLPTVSLDTVYRTLRLFNELGLVTPLHPGVDRARFDTDVTPHHHFVCSSCGAIFDLIDPVLESLPAPASAAIFGRVDRVHIEFSGRCSACLKKSGQR